MEACLCVTGFFIPAVVSSLRILIKPTGLVGLSWLVPLDPSLTDIFAYVHIASDGLSEKYDHMVYGVVDDKIS